MWAHITFLKRVKIRQRSRSGNMEHAFPVACHLCAAALKDRIKRKERLGRRGGNSRNVLVSSLVPVTRLETHASWLARALWQSDSDKRGNVRWLEQPKWLSQRRDRLLACLSGCSTDVCVCVYYHRKRDLSEPGLFVSPLAALSCWEFVWLHNCGKFFVCGEQKRSNGVEIRRSQCVATKDIHLCP